MQILAFLLRSGSVLFFKVCEWEDKIASDEMKKAARYFMVPLVLCVRNAGEPVIGINGARFIAASEAGIATPTHPSLITRSPCGSIEHMTADTAGSRAARPVAGIWPLIHKVDP